MMIKKICNKYIKSKILFFLSIILGLTGFVVTIMYYKGVIKNNFLEYFIWPLSMIMLVISAKSSDSKINFFNKKNILCVVIITCIYWTSHLYGYNSAPWNNYGLFDDGAWDILISKQKCFTSNSFEIIYWDGDIGAISRELLFHYYITIFFKLFGYNMFVFNISLTLLGYITVLFTTLIAIHIFKSNKIGLIVGIFLNFFPLHFTQVSMGHRYAICPPLMMISLYFILKSIDEKNIKKSVIGGLFAGLTMESAIMGKQYIWGLIASLLIYLLLNRKSKTKIKQILLISMFILIGYIIACLPLYSYIFTHGKLYRFRESGLIKEFFNRLIHDGFKVVTANLKILLSVLFDKISGSRQFSEGFPIITWYWAFSLLGGIICAIKKKWYYLVIMLFIPIIGNIVTISYDFRLLITAPFIAILIVQFVNYICIFLQKKFKFKKVFKDLLLIIIVTIYLIEPVKYIYTLTTNPNSQFYLRHNDLAVSRYIQDVVAGDLNPNYSMKWNEFNYFRKNIKYDVMAATYTSFAHINTFLQSYNRRDILSLFGNIPYIGSTKEMIAQNIVTTFKNYKITNKDLFIVLEYNEYIEDVINNFLSTNLCEYSEYSKVIDGRNIKMVNIYIKNKDLNLFRKKIIEIFGV